MGAGIAQVSIDKKNLFTVLKDVNDPGLSRGVFQVKDGLSKKIKRKKISALDSERQITAIKNAYFLPFDFLGKAIFDLKYSSWQTKIVNIF